MKKIGIIALVVILTLGVIGVGYAVWSQTLNINSTVSVANFDVRFDTTTNPPAIVGSKGLSIVGSPTADSITLSFENVKPGDGDVLTYHVLNNSSIPVGLAFTYQIDAGSPVNWNGSTVELVRQGADPNPVALLTMSNTGFANGDILAKNSNTTGTLTFSMTGVGSSYAGSAVQTVTITFVATQQ